MTRFLVCGSRDWTDPWAILRELKLHQREATMIHGACETGADAIAGALWEFGGGPLWPFPANWRVHLAGCRCPPGRSYCGAQGPARNQRMLDEGKPELVLAFHKGNSRGTADMIARARKAGVPVKVITPTKEG